MKKAGHACKLEKHFYLLVFLFFALIYLTTMKGLLDVPDAFPSFKTAKSIIERGALDIELVEDKYGPLIGDADTKEEIFIYFRTKDGKIYSKYGLGLPIYMIPFILIGKFFYMLFGARLAVGVEFFEKFAVSSMNGLPIAFACLLLIKFARRMGFSFATSFTLSIFLGVGTMAWFYANSVFSEPLLMLELLAGVYFAFKASQTKQRSDIAVSAICIGLLFFTKITTLIILPILILYVVHSQAKQKDKNSIIIFSSIITFFIVLILWINYIRFGNIFQTGYGQELQIALIKRPVWLIYSIFFYLFSFENGLFIYNPLLIISLFSLSQYHKAQKNLFFLLLAMSMTYLITHAITVRSLLEAWGPRYLLVLIPFFILPIGYLLQKRKKVIYCAMAFLFMAAFVINLASVLVQHPEYQSMRRFMTKRSVRLPSDIFGIPILLINKLKMTSAVDISREFGINTIPLTEAGTPTTTGVVALKGLDLWYIYLDQETGCRKGLLFLWFSIPLIIILFNMALSLAKKLDKDPLPLP